MTAHAPIFAPGVKALEARYREDAAVPAAWNDVLDLLLAHRSVRHYLPDPLAEGTIELIVAAAQSAATSSNLQFWSVVAVTDPARRAKLAAVAGNQRHIVVAPVILVFLADLSRAARVAERLAGPVETLDYVESFLVAAIDAALAAQNAVVAAESLGLGTVYIGALRNDIAAVAAELNLPPQVTPVFGLVIGHPDPARPADIKPRLPRAAVLHRETYDAGAEAAAVADYDARLRTFQAEQRLPEQDWSRIVASRIATRADLRGRDRLRPMLEALGFGLK